MGVGFDMHVSDYDVCGTVSLLSVFHLCRWKLLKRYLNCALSSQIFTLVVALKTSLNCSKKKKKKKDHILYLLIVIWFFATCNCDFFFFGNIKGVIANPDSHLS